jgi:hypothetical protein
MGQRDTGDWLSFRSILDMAIVESLAAVFRVKFLPVTILYGITLVLGNWRAAGRAQREMMRQFGFVEVVNGKEYFDTDPLNYLIELSGDQNLSNMFENMFRTRADDLGNTRKPLVEAAAASSIAIFEWTDSPFGQAKADGGEYVHSYARRDKRGVLDTSATLIDINPLVRVTAEERRDWRARQTLLQRNRNEPLRKKMTIDRCWFWTPDVAMDQFHNDISQLMLEWSRFASSLDTRFAQNRNAVSKGSKINFLSERLGHIGWTSDIGRWLVVHVFMPTYDAVFDSPNAEGERLSQLMPEVDWVYKNLYPLGFLPQNYTSEGESAAGWLKDTYRTLRRRGYHI